MRSSAALLVGVLLLGSALAGTGAGRPADDPVRAPRAVSDAPTAAAPSATALASPRSGSSPSSHAGPVPTSSSPRVRPQYRPPQPASTSPHAGGVSPPDIGAVASSDLYTASGAPRDRAASNSSASANGSNVTVRDGTEMYVSIHEDGDARWNVSARFVLDDENETAAFRTLAERYENGDADVGFARETFDRVAERATAATDRRMVIRNATRSARLVENGTVGVLSLSFTWTNFTRVEGDRIALGDAFWVGSETWLPALSADQRLVIEGPSGHYVSSSNVPHNGTRIEFEGPRTFERGDFSVVYRPRSPPTTTTRTTRTTVPTTTTTTDGVLPDLTDPSGLIVVLLLFGLGGGAYAWSQRRGAADESEDDDPDGAPPTLPLADDGDDAEAGDDADEDDDQPPTELLSDEERVLRLLRDNDGRMKQAQIVKETNWSNAKVSQLLSKMAENDDVDKLRIGRENLITLPDEDVTDFE